MNVFFFKTTVTNEAVSKILQLRFPPVKQRAGGQSQPDTVLVLGVCPVGSECRMDLGTSQVFVWLKPRLKCIFFITHFLNYVHVHVVVSIVFKDFELKRKRKHT